MSQELQQFTWYCWAFAGYSVIIILGLVIYGGKYIKEQIKSH